MSPGFRVRHSKPCPARSGGRCTCKPSYQANVWSAREGKRLFRTFPTLAEAKVWRAGAQVALRQGTMRAGASGRVSFARASVSIDHAPWVCAVPDAADEFHVETPSK